MANKKLWLGMLVTTLAFGFILAGCPQDSDNGGLKKGKVYLQSGTGTAKSVRSVRNDNGGEDTIEFLVSNLVLVRDDAPTNGWLIGNFDNTFDGHVNNIGWYDIASLKQAEVSTPLNGAPHSCVRLSIKAIKLKDTFIFYVNGEGQPISNPESQPQGEFALDSNNQFDIVAGDLSKLGSHENAQGAENIGFVGVPAGKEQVEEFIIFVDTSKLLTEDNKLTTDWWECFSFSVQ